MAAMPLEPESARMVLAAEGEHCTREALLLASLFSLQSVFTVSRKDDLEKARAEFAATCRCVTRGPLVRHCL